MGIRMLLKRLIRSAVTFALLGLAVVIPQTPAHAAIGEVYGPYYLMNSRGGVCLADPNASTGNNVQMILWNCGSGGQKFNNETAVTTTDYWTFNADNGKCLAPLNASKASGAAIVQTSCTTATSGRWAYHAAGDGSTICVFIIGKLNCSNKLFTIQNLNSGMCISTQGGTPANGTKVVQVSCGDDTAKYWRQFVV